MCFSFQTDFSGQPLYADLYRKLKSSSREDLYALHHLSNKCKKMLEMIKGHYQDKGKDARILVFVDMRRTARKLCACLQRFFDIRVGLNPQVIVGRGLCGDGLTIEEQQEILNDFRRGQTRLLITTTILEEGLDVPSCNMVLRMKAPGCLRQFVQSRGRACRSEDGKFFIICKDVMESQMQQHYLTCMEAQSRVIKQMMAQTRIGRLASLGKTLLNLEADSGRTERQPQGMEHDSEEEDEDEELKEIIAIMMQDAGPEQEDKRFMDEYEPEEVALAVKFALFSANDDRYAEDVSALKQDIEAFCSEVELEGWKDVQLNVKNILGTPYYPQVTLKLKEAKGMEDFTFFEKMVLELFMSSVFVVDSGFWMSICSPRVYFPRSTALRLSLHQTSVGSLKSPTEFLNRMALGRASNLRMERTADKITITINDRFQVEGSFAHLRGFALVDRQPGNSFEEPLIHLYLTFTQTPRLSEIRKSANAEKATICRVVEYDTPGSRHIFGSCLTYKLEIPNPPPPTGHCAIDHRVRQVLKLLESSGVTVYYTSVKENMMQLDDLPPEEEGVDPRLCRVHKDSKEVNYAMKCVKSSPGFVPERIDQEFYVILDSLAEKEAARALYGLTKALNKNLFCDITEQLNMEARLAEQTVDEFGCDRSHAYIKRVAVTPTSIRFYEPDYMQVCHLTDSTGLIGLALDESDFEGVYDRLFHQSEHPG